MTGTPFLASFANGSGYGIIQTKIMTKSSSFFWDIYARLYDSLNLLEPYQKLHSQVFDELGLKEHEIILDAGCGTGNF